MSKTTTEKKNTDTEEIEEIVNKLESLNLIKLDELCEKLKQKHGIKINDGSSVSPSTSSSVTTESKSEKVSVKIKNIATGVNQLKLYNDIRGMIKEISGEEKTLLQIREIIKKGDNILENVPFSKTEKIKKELEGVEIEIK